MIDEIEPDEEKRSLEDLIDDRNILREKIDNLEDELCWKLEDELCWKLDENYTPNRSAKQWEGCPVDDWDDEMKEWTDQVNEIRCDLNEAWRELQDVLDEIEDRESSEE